MRFLDLKREIKRWHLIRVNENKHEGITEPTGYVKVYSVCKKKKSHTILIFTNANKTHPTYFQIIWLWNLTNEKSKEKNPKHKSFPL